MAVDVEPEVFWDGGDAAEHVQRWKNDAGFVDGDEIGSDGHAEAFGNGPSGRTLRSYLTALRVQHSHTVYLDVYPVFLVHRSAGSQGAAVARDYDPVTPFLRAGREPSTLPARPSATKLPGLAAERFGGWLVDSIASLRPDLVVTLGEESWAALAQVDGIELGHPAKNLSATRSHYGREGTLSVGGREVAWYPLAHPGLLSKNAEWKAAHQAWADSERA